MKTLAEIQAHDAQVQQLFELLNQLPDTAWHARWYDTPYTDGCVEYSTTLNEVEVLLDCWGLKVGGHSVYTDAAPGAKTRLYNRVARIFGRQMRGSAEALLTRALGA